MACEQWYVFPQRHSVLPSLWNLYLSKTLKKKPNQSTSFYPKEKLMFTLPLPCKD